MSLILLLAVPILTYIFYRTFIFIRRVKKFWDYGEKIPGPPAHPIYGNMLDVQKLDPSDMYKWFNEEARKVRESGGNVFRLQLLGKLYIWPLDGEALKTILDSTTELNKGDDYHFLDPWLGGGLLFEGVGDRWKSHRRLLTPTFHFAKLEGYFEVFNQEAQNLVDILEPFAISNDTVDTFPYVKRCALDIICGTAMGKTVGAQFNTEHTYVKAVEGINRLSIVYAFRPYLWIPLIYQLLGYQSQKENYLTTLKKFTSDVIKERRQAIADGEEIEKTKRKMNFLDLLLSMEESNGLSEEDLRQEVDTFMFAGHDTTSSSTSWTLWCLAHHPEVQEKCAAELFEVFGNEDREVTIEDLSKLTYLDRVTKEAKRCIPPVPVVQRKLINDIDMGKYKIPSEATVVIGPMVVHANHLVYDKPFDFNPDNFLPDNMASRHAYDYIPFSAGLRNCIGQKFAQYNEKVMLSWILRKYRLVPQLGFHETRRSIEVVTMPSKGIPVKLYRR